MFCSSMHSILRKSLTQAVKWQYIRKSVIDVVDAPLIESKDMTTMNVFI